MTHDDYEFKPEAMLPGWLVTDADLVVRNMNDLADDMIADLSGELGSAEGYNLSLSLTPLPPYRSLWELMFAMDKDKTTRYCIQHAMHVLAEQRMFLDEFIEKPTRLQELVEKINSYGTGRVIKGVVPYCYYHEGKDKLTMGVKVSPLSGLKLRKPINLHRIKMGKFKYLDVVIAYRIDNEGGRLTVRGTQPALHDATERHRLWIENKRNEQSIKHAEIEEKTRSLNRFLSHAFKTPLANIQKYVKLLRMSDPGEEDRETFLRMVEGRVGDLTHLVNFLYFVSTYEKYKTRVSLSESDEIAETVNFTCHDIEERIAVSFESVSNGRTEQSYDVTKLGLMAEAADVRPQAAADSTGAEGLTYHQCAEVARHIFRVEGVARDQRFYLRPRVNGDSNHRDTYGEVSRKAKHVLLDLVFPEVIINAVKYADETNPVVNVVLGVDSEREVLSISVFNNGAGQLSHHGEKRKSLGRMLNEQASEQLGWSTTLVACGGGTLCTVAIPLEPPAPPYPLGSGLHAEHRGHR